MTLEEQREQLFVDYYEEWMTKYKKDVVREVTYIKYKTTLRWLKKLAPDVTMRQLTKSEYQNILNRYALEHEKTTVQDFHHMLRASLIDAYDERILERDISHRAVIKGKLSNIHKRTKYLNKKELEKLLEVLDTGNKINWDWFIMLIAKTGLRFEEALALTPGDFDFNNLKIHITKAFDYKITNEFCKTKNESSVRSILLDYRTALNFEKLTKGMDPDERIFNFGPRIYSSTANNFLHRKCKEAGIREISVHGLRHTHASILMSEGVTLQGHDPQFETERKPLLWDMAEDTKEALISPIKIMQNDNMMTVVKTPGGARLINDARLAMVNPDKCRDDENPPSTFAVHGDWLVSCNDEMAVGICFTSPVYKPELEVLRLLSGVDFYWIETPHYEL